MAALSPLDTLNKIQLNSASSQLTLSWTQDQFSDIRNELSWTYDWRNIYQSKRNKREYFK